MVNSRSGNNFNSFTRKRNFASANSTGTTNREPLQYNSSQKTNKNSAKRLKIDREKNCPFLLRVFCSEDQHNKPDAYDNISNKAPKNELHIYTWPDASLKEIRELIQDADERTKKETGRLSFSFAYPDRRGRYVMRKVGVLSCGLKKTSDEEKTLAGVNFQIGDFLDVAILSSPQS